MKLNARSILTAALVVALQGISIAEGKNPFEGFAELSLDELHNRAKERQPGALMELALRKDRTAIPLLRELARAKPSKEEIAAARNRKALFWGYQKTRTRAKIALARMNDEPSFQEFIVGLSTTNGEWKADCIEALGYIGDSRAVKHLGPLLFDDTGPDLGSIHEISLSFGNQAGRALSKILPDEFAVMKKQNPDFHEIKQEEFWRKWWLKNRDKYK